MDLSLKTGYVLFNQSSKSATHFIKWRLKFLYLGVDKVTGSILNLPGT